MLERGVPVKRYLKKYVEIERQIQDDKGDHLFPATYCEHLHKLQWHLSCNKKIRSRTSTMQLIRDTANHANNEDRGFFERMWECANAQACVSEDELKTAFKTVDADNSNAVEIGEFYELLKLLKCPGSEDKAAAEALFKKIDTDNSGSLELDELVQYFVKK